MPSTLERVKKKESKERKKYARNSKRMFDNGFKKWHKREGDFSVLLIALVVFYHLVCVCMHVGVSCCFFFFLFLLSLDLRCFVLPLVIVRAKSLFLLSNVMLCVNSFLLRSLLT